MVHLVLNIFQCYRISGDKHGYLLSTTMHAWPNLSVNALLRRGFWLWYRLKGLGAMAVQDVISDNSPGSSRSPKSRVGDFSLEGIPLQWDNDPTVRERMRENQNLCLAYNESTGQTTSTFVDATISNLKLNASVLKPLVVLMKENDRQLPSIHALITAVENYFVLAKLSRTSDQCYQEGWSIRRLISKLKKFTYRATPPQDWFWICCLNILAILHSVQIYMIYSFRMVLFNTPLYKPQ